MNLWWFCENHSILFFFATMRLDEKKKTIQVRRDGAHPFDLWAGWVSQCPNARVCQSKKESQQQRRPNLSPFYAAALFVASLPTHASVRTRFSLRASRTCDYYKPAHLVLSQYAVFNVLRCSGNDKVTNHSSIIRVHTRLLKQLTYATDTHSVTLL